MNKELLANIRNILIPTLASHLKKTNYEGQGEKDAIEFTHDMTEIFDLAEQQLSAHPNWIPVTERQPNHELAIVQYSDGDFDLLQFPTAYRWKDIVAWMPLPEPWRGEEDDA